LTHNTRAMALLTKYTALLIEYRALLEEYRALLIEHRALEHNKRRLMAILCQIECCTLSLTYYSVSLHILYNLPIISLISIIRYSMCERDIVCERETL